MQPLQIEQHQPVTKLTLTEAAKEMARQHREGYRHNDVVWHNPYQTNGYAVVGGKRYTIRVWSGSEWIDWNPRQDAAILRERDRIRKSMRCLSLGTEMHVSITLTRQAQMYYIKLRDHAALGAVYGAGL